MSEKTYFCMYNRDALKAGHFGTPEEAEDLIGEDRLDHGYSIFRRDGEKIVLVASDGGEPEDQTLNRNWRWVVNELNAAFERGKAER